MKMRTFGTILKDICTSIPFFSLILNSADESETLSLNSVHYAAHNSVVLVCNYI